MRSYIVTDMTTRVGYHSRRWPEIWCR